MELTDVKFWEDYWAGCKLPSEVDLRFSFDRCLARELKKRLPPVEGDVLEIGCAPGKWLVFMQREFGLVPHGIEYCEAGTVATRRNFDLLGVSAGDILAGDFFALAPQPKYDVVMSFGFIEHFSDPASVVERHLAWLKPGGILVLGIPNFHGVYSMLQQVLDPEVLNKHNLEIMNQSYLSQLGSKLRLVALHIGYLGSFEPSLPIASPERRGFPQMAARAFLRIARNLRFEWMDRFNHPIVSSYLLAIYRKGCDS